MDCSWFQQGMRACSSHVRCERHLTTRPPSPIADDCSSAISTSSSQSLFLPVCGCGIIRGWLGTGRPPPLSHSRLVSCSQKRPVPRISPRGLAGLLSLSQEPMAMWNAYKCVQCVCACMGVCVPCTLHTWVPYAAETELTLCLVRLGNTKMLEILKWLPFPLKVIQNVGFFPPCKNQSCEKFYSIVKGVFP